MINTFLEINDVVTINEGMYVFLCRIIRIRIIRIIRIIVYTYLLNARKQWRYFHLRFSDFLIVY